MSHAPSHSKNPVDRSEMSTLTHWNFSLGDGAWMTTHSLPETTPWPLKIHRDSWCRHLGPPTTKGAPSIPTDSTWVCLLQNLKWLTLSGTKSLHLVHYSAQAWPLYPLDNPPKWPSNSSLHPNIIPDPYNFCEHIGRSFKFLLSLLSASSLLYDPYTL